MERLPADGITYPVYTAAGAVIALSRMGGRANAEARDAWLADLRQRQLTEELGWMPADSAYGGWSYARIGRGRWMESRRRRWRRRICRQRFLRLEALRGGLDAKRRTAIQKALVFVKRCQNWNDERALRDARFDDGGFFFIVDDPQRNKAGERARMQRANALCVLRQRDGRWDAGADVLRREGRSAARAAARQWLEADFSAGEHPGQYAAAACI